MAVYVDDVRHAFGRMVMCHLWADSLEELHAEAAALGLKRAWFQAPPKASWQHYDVSLGVKAKALARGAVLTDLFGPVEHEARRRIATGAPGAVAWGERRLAMVAYSRALRADPPPSADELAALRRAIPRAPAAALGVGA